MSKFILKVFLCFVCSIVLCDAYKVLVVFPFPGKSHSLLGEGYVRHLINAGHEVTYITAIPMKNPSSRLRQVEVSSNFNLLPSDDLLDIAFMINNKVDFRESGKVFDMMDNIANATLTHKEVQKLLHEKREEYDVVVAEWLYSELYIGFSYVFGCPFIWSSSMDPHGMVLSLIDDEPNPAYTPDNMSSIVAPFTFWERVEELWYFVQRKYYKWLRSGIENEMFQKSFSAAASERGRTLPPLDEAKYNVSLMLGNSHNSVGISLRLPQNYIHIGGYHIDEDVKPLPKDLKDLLDGAKNGLIYFSMGSILKSKSMPDEMKKGLLKMFSGLKQTILWKFEENLPDLPKNVRIVQWAPQFEILSHPNCVLFITHGGLLSMIETVHIGVPIIGIPMFADQFTNVNRAVKKGFAKRVDLNMDTPDNLKTAIEDILGNPSYSQRVKELSFIFHHRPVAPGKELVHWVEHAVRTRGAAHLRSPALDLVWYQKMYLDLATRIVLAIAVVAFVAKTLVTVRKDSVAKKSV